MKKDGKNIKGEKCVKGKHGKIGFGEKNRKRMWKYYVEKIINNKGDWDHMAEAIIEEPVEKVIRKK